MHLISELYAKWNYLILFLAGTYAILLGGGVLPIKFSDREYSEKWRKRYSGALKVGGLMAIIAGISSLLFALFS
jgi:hypothetical protein